MLISMLTTYDNPYSPFDDWDNWFSFDLSHGYNSSGLVARIAVVSSDLSDKDYNQAITIAIDEIVKENVSGIHKKVTKEI